MILKLSYQDEIHRISEAPNRLSDLYALIISSFRTTLPQQISLSYSIKDEVENIPINSQEDYDALLSKGSSKPAKIHIRETSAEQKLFEPAQVDYDVIANEKTKNAVDYRGEEKKEESEKDKLMSMGGLIENVSESMIIPQVPKYPYVAEPEEADQKIRSVVREILKEQMPSIIAQVKDAVLMELKGSMPVNQPKPEPVNPFKNYNYQPVVNRVEDEDRKVNIDVRGNEVKFENADVYRRDIEEVVERPAVVRQEDRNDLVNKMKKFGVALKEQIAVLPGKAKDTFDELAQKLEGDPYVTLEEGKFPKSVVDKVALLREIFPEEDKGMLLQFVKQYPRNVTLEQLANMYLLKDEPQEQENAA